MPVLSVGADYSRARPTAAQLKAHDIKFVCRYLLDDARDGGKALKLPEARQLSALGISIAANFEYATQPTLTFAQGAADARTALAELKALGAPRHDVYFSFDYNVPPSDFPGVLAYLRGAESQLGKGHAGAYGHYRLVEYLAGHGIRLLWQCYAWSGGLWSVHALVRQVKNGAFPGEFDGDLNHAYVADFGQWTLGDDMTPEELMNYEVPSPALGPQKVGELLKQGMVANRGLSAVRVDIAGLDTRLAGLTAAVTAVLQSGGSLDSAAILARIDEQAAASRSQVASLQADLDATQARAAELAAQLAAALGS